MTKNKTTQAAQHTPGPWTQGKHERGTIERRGPDGLLIQVIATVGSEGDARLIAAAPELLEGARLLLAHLETTSEAVGIGGFALGSPGARILRAAILHATEGK